MKRSASRAGASSSCSSCPVSVLGTGQRYRPDPAAGLEIHPLPEPRAEAAGLLAERFARQRAAEPLLPEIGDFTAHVAQDDDDGVVATRGGRAVAYLVGAPKDGIATVGFADHAASEPDALRDL